MSRLGAAFSSTLRREPADSVDSGDGARASENGHGEGIVTATWLVLAAERVSVNFGGVSENVSKRTSSHPTCDPAPSTNEDGVCHPGVDKAS